MTTPLYPSLIDEQVADEQDRAQIRGTLVCPKGMRVADLPYPIKAEWLKRRPIAKPRPCP